MVPRSGIDAVIRPFYRTPWWRTKGEFHLLAALTYSGTGVIVLLCGCGISQRNASSIGRCPPSRTCVHIWVFPLRVLRCRENSTWKRKVMGSIFDMRDILQSRTLWRLSTTQCCSMTVAVTYIKMQTKNISSRSRIKRRGRGAGTRLSCTTFRFF